MHVPYTYVKVSENRWQVNQGSTFVGLRETEAEAQATVAEYERQEREYESHTAFGSLESWGSRT